MSELKPGNGRTLDVVPQLRTETDCSCESSEFSLYSLNESNLRGFGQRIAAIEGVGVC